MKKASTFLIPFSAILMIFACSNSDDDTALIDSSTGSTTVPWSTKRFMALLVLHPMELM